MITEDDKKIIDKNGKEYCESIKWIADTQFKAFINKISDEIDDMISEYNGTISNEHLMELGHSIGYNYHSDNIEAYIAMVQRLRKLKEVIETV